MPLKTLGRALLVALAALAALGAAGPAGAQPSMGPGRGHGPRPHVDRHAPMRPLAPEVRFRDPRYVPAPIRRPRFAAPPTDLVHAYLPRNTELPMYNEPPSRFPQR